MTICSHGNAEFIQLKRADFQKAAIAINSSGRSLKPKSILVFIHAEIGEREQMRRRIDTSEVAYLERVIRQPMISASFIKHDRLVFNRS